MKPFFEDPARMLRRVLPRARTEFMKPFFEDPARMLRRVLPGARTEFPLEHDRLRETRQNGDRPDTLFHDVPAGAFEATLAGEITDANGALADLLGYSSRQELVGSSLADLPGDQVRLDRVLEHAREGQEIAGEEVSLRTRERDEVVVLLCTKLKGAAGAGGGRLVGTVIDITERKRRETDLERLAFEDPLTGLANRRALEEHAEKYLALAERRGTPLGLLYLDLTRFKAINDRHGHAAGDTVLVEVARRLEAGARESDVVSRVGGDEFVVLLPDVEDLDALVTAGRRMLGKLNEAPVELEDARTAVRAEAGIAVYPEHGADFEELLRAADQAMYRAKKADGEADPAAEEEPETRSAIVTVAGGRTSPRRTTWH